MEHVLQNTGIGSKNYDLKIICAILNKYSKRLISDERHQEMIVERIKSRMTITHELVHFIINQRSNLQQTCFRRFNPLTRRLLDPPFNEHNYYTLVTGNYLLKFIDAYMIFILLDLDRSGVDRLAGWCCKCLSGLKTVNPCAHVICALSTLCSGFECRAPAPRLSTIFSIEHGEESSE